MVELLLLPQRYEFSSKSQQVNNVKNALYRCCLEQCFDRQAMRVSYTDLACHNSDYKKSKKL